MPASPSSPAICSHSDNRAHHGQRSLRRHHHRLRAGRRHDGVEAGADRQAHPAARARRLSAARAGELGQPGGVRRCPLPGEGDLVQQLDGDTLPSRPALLRRRQQQGLRRRAVPAARARISAKSATRTASRPPGRSATTSSSRTIRPPRNSITCTACAARIRPSRPARSPMPIRRSRTSRASSNCSTSSSAIGHHPFHLPVGALIQEKDGEPLPHSPCMRCDAFDGYPCPTNGKADAQVMCVDPALRAHHNLTLLTRSLCREAAHRSGRTRGHRRRGRRPSRRAQRRSPPTSWSWRAARCPRRC